MVSGSGISRYGPVRTTGWIMYDPEYVKSRGDRGRTLPAERFLSSEKILVVRTRNLSLSTRIIATLDDSGAYNLNRLSNIIARPEGDLRGLLAVLNSALFNWIFSTRYFDYEIKPVYLRAAPTAFTCETELCSAAEAMMQHTLLMSEARTDREGRLYSRHADALARRIDRLVYELYGLSDDEIRTVESHSVDGRTPH